MPFTPEPPFPKSRGDTIRSLDWNNLINEVIRLDTDKVNKAGDAMTGPLSVSGNFGIGTATPKVDLEINSNGPDDAPLLGVSTPDSADFIALSGGRQGNQQPHLVWRRGALRMGTANTYGGQAFSEKLRIMETGNVGLGVAAPAERLHLNGSIRGNQAGALRVSTGQGFIDLGPKNASFCHIQTDRPVFYFDKEVQVDTGNIGSHNENLSLRTAGTTHMTILNGSGRVGIGTTGPSHPLHVTTGTGGWQARLTNGSSDILMNHASGYGMHLHTGQNDSSSRYGLVVRNNQRYHLYVRDDGHIGIGTSSPGHPLRVTTALTGNWQARFSNGSANVYLNHHSGYGIHINTGHNNSSGRYGLEVRNNQGTHLYVRDDGRVGIGTRSPVSGLHVVKNRIRLTRPGNANKYIDLFTHGSELDILARGGRLFINNGGTQTRVFNAVHASSRELKRDITPHSLQEALTVLQKLNPVSFIYKTDTEQETHIGFIAEEVPELLASKDKQAVDYNGVVSVLTKVVSEQHRQITTLQSEIEDLKLNLRQD